MRGKMLAVSLTKVMQKTLGKCHHMQAIALA
jgi:hypothetical protein